MGREEVGSEGEEMEEDDDMDLDSDLDFSKVSDAGTTTIKLSPTSSHLTQQATLSSPTKPKPKPKPKSTPSVRQESPKKATPATKPPTPTSKLPLPAPTSKKTTKKTISEVVDNPRRGRAPKPSRGKPRGGRAGYSTSTSASAHPPSSRSVGTGATRSTLPDEEEYEDFSALIDQIGDVSSDEDGDSMDGVVGMLGGVSLSTPKRFRYL